MPVGTILAALFWSFVGFCVFSVVRSIRRSAGEADSMRKWAAQNGWTYSPEDPAIARRWSGVPFEHEHDPRATSVLHGAVNGWPVAWFRFGGGELIAENPNGTPSYVRHHRQVTALTLPAALPELMLVPETIVAKARMRRYRLVDLQIGLREFDERWQIGAFDQNFACHVLRPQLQRFLLEECHRCSFRILGDTLLLWQESIRRFDEMAWHIHLVTEFARLLPADVWMWSKATGDPRPKPSPADPWRQLAPQLQLAPPPVPRRFPPKSDSATEVSGMRRPGPDSANTPPPGSIRPRVVEAPPSGAPQPPSDCFPRPDPSSSDPTSRRGPPPMGGDTR